MQGSAQGSACLPYRHPAHPTWHSFHADISIARCSRVTSSTCIRFGAYRASRIVFWCSCASGPRLTRDN